MEEVARHRRFALAVGLVLLVYSLAGVELSKGDTITPLGIPLKIMRPDWLSMGLVFASIYATYRYVLHAMYMRESPRRSRYELKRSAKQCLIDKIAHARRELAINETIIANPNPPIFQQKQNAIDEAKRINGELAEHEAKLAELNRAFGLVERFTVDDSLDVLRQRVAAAFPSIGRVKPNVFDSGKPTAEIPRRLRIAARLIDFDYELPLTVNAIAIVVALVRWLGPYAWSSIRPAS